MNFDILGKSLHHQMVLGPPDGSLFFFLNTRGFWLNGLRRKSILKENLSPEEKKRETGKTSKTSIVLIQRLPLLCFCLGPMPFCGPMAPGTIIHRNSYAFCWILGDDQARYCQKLSFSTFSNIWAPRMMIFFSGLSVHTFFLRRSSW